MNIRFVSRERMVIDFYPSQLLWIYFSHEWMADLSKSFFLSIVDCENSTNEYNYYYTLI